MSSTRVFSAMVAILAGLVVTNTAWALSAGGAKAAEGCERAFMFDGAPVSAQVIAAFEPFISDRSPSIVTEINLSAARHSNEYAAKTQLGPRGQVVADMPDTHYAYHVVGCAHDTFVLETERAPTGGSAVFKSVLFVRLDTRQAYGAAGRHLSRQTFVSVTRRIPMGDRDTAAVTLQGDKLRIGSSRYRDGPLVMRVAGETE
ncbi:hypothetical protein [Salinisphaera japonica]|uniref:Uncharacterized protein n=1 Tax=Salinisphaera japonica YTM-1 TaxID=1209778 RepID=A0A423PPZ0_9GAMM|nr:hypothetical protein [Salinisphaera japonica]ROO27591.1 hypothetical protein SAJA_09190 [Salinisphaera japonica YTM-1]